MAIAFFLVRQVRLNFSTIYLLIHSCLLLLLFLLLIFVVAFAVALCCLLFNLFFLCVLDFLLVFSVTFCFGLFVHIELVFFFTFLSKTTPLGGRGLQFVCFFMRFLYLFV